MPVMEQQEKKFSSQKFYRHDFSGQNLERADFRNASLIECNFTDAKLRQANFEGANCFGANFTNADCNRTNFKDAVLGNTLFYPKDMFGATLTMSCETFEGMKVKRLWWFCFLQFALMMVPEKDAEEKLRDRLIGMIGPKMYVALSKMFPQRTT